jgi:hypothetical protein
MDTNQYKMAFDFMQLVTETFGMGIDHNCGKLTDDSFKVMVWRNSANGLTSEPAVQLIWNHLFKIDKIYEDFDDTVFRATILPAPHSNEET